MRKRGPEMSNLMYGLRGSGLQDGLNCCGELGVVSLDWAGPAASESGSGGQLEDPIVDPVRAREMLLLCLQKSVWGQDSLEDLLRSNCGVLSAAEGGGGGCWESVRSSARDEATECRSSSTVGMEDCCRTVCL